jgi:hypothetical protein
MNKRVISKIMLIIIIFTICLGSVTPVSAKAATTTASFDINPKQSGNTIMFYDTDSDGILSQDEVMEQITAANPDPNEGIKASFSDNINTIGKAAFYNVWRLKDISLSEGLVILEDQAFEGTGVESVAFPKSLRTIGENAFDNIKALTDVNFQEGITSIGACAFAGASINGITLPKSLTVLGEGAFYKCTNLTSVDIPGGLKRIEDNTFYQDTALTDVKLTGVTHIGYHAFYQCSSLVKLNLPATLSTIGNNPFDLCDKLTDLSVDPANTAFAVQDSALYSKDLSTIYEYLYASASKTLVLPSQVTTIKEAAFQNTGIERVTLSAELKTIEDLAFCSCQALKGIQLPEGLENIGEDAFSGCSSLTEELVIPKSMKTFGGEAFHGTGLKNVTINSNIDLSNNLFMECEKLETVKINGDCTKIGDSAFRYCSKLKSVSLPKTLKSIASSAFGSCSSLPEIILPQGLVNLGTRTKTDELNEGEDGGVFSGCTKLKSIVLPDRIEFIQGGSFSDCQSLKSVTLPLNKKYVKIEKETFYGCLSLNNVFIPRNIKTVGDSSFCHSGLTTMTIEPYGVKTIERSAFSETKLKEVVIPVGVVNIYALAFSNIKPLKTVTLSSTVGNIGMKVFCALPSCTRVNFIAHNKIDIGILNFEDKAFMTHGAIHVPKNFKGGYKNHMGEHVLVYDLPVLPEGKAEY